MAEIIFETGLSRGTAQALLADTRQLASVLLEIPVRAARGARTSLRTQIQARFGRKPHRGGQAFPDTLPKIPPKLEDMGGGARGARVRTKALFRKRRAVVFDLFWFFDNAPQTVASTRGRLLAVPIPGAGLPPVGRGTTRAVPWPRDLKSQGWTLSILPAGRAGNRNPIIMGGPPGSTRKRLRPLFVLVPRVMVRRRLDVRGTADRFARRMPNYERAALARLDRQQRRRFPATRT
jgi:hypothetical protein